MRAFSSSSRDMGLPPGKRQRFGAAGSTDNSGGNTFASFAVLLEVRLRPMVLAIMIACLILAEDAQAWIGSSDAVFGWSEGCADSARERHFRHGDHGEAAV